MRDNSTRFKSREFAFMEGVALGTRSRVKSAELEEGILTALKNKPRAVRHALAVRNGLIRCAHDTMTQWKKAYDI